MSRVSLIVPVYNGERYLAEALGSALAQTGAAVDVIVVDDGSTDRSADVAAGFGPAVRVVRQEHAGLAAARNTGVGHAEGEFLAFLDADDLWLPLKLERQIAALRENPRASLAFGHVEQFISPDLAPEQKALLHCDPAPAPGYIGSALLMRTAALAQTGRWDTSFVLGEFIEWHVRARDAGLIDVMCPQTVTRRRLHRANLGVTRRDARKDYARMVKAALDRRRASA